MPAVLAPCPVLVAMRGPSLGGAGVTPPHPGGGDARSALRARYSRMRSSITTPPAALTTSTDPARGHDYEHHPVADKPAQEGERDADRAELAGRRRDRMRHPDRGRERERGHAHAGEDGGRRELPPG